MKIQFKAVAVSVGLALAAPALAQEDLNFDAYREMLADGNPAELYEMEGEELWRTARGPKNASLEQNTPLSVGLSRGCQGSSSLRRAAAAVLEWCSLTTNRQTSCYCTGTIGMPAVRAASSPPRRLKALAKPSSLSFFISASADSSWAHVQ